MADSLPFDRPHAKSHYLAFLVLLLMCGLNQPADGADLSKNVSQLLGAGNLEADLPQRKSDGLFEALASLGMKSARLNVYSWRDAAGKFTPSALDAGMNSAWKHGITPVILLEYYGSYANASPPKPIGGYEQWFSIGKAVAERYRPGGTWASVRGINNWGASIFTAFNEPDVEQSISKTDYHNAMAGLADGVHSVDVKLKVIPGGFATCNSQWDASLKGYGPAIADLLNSGKLDGIDLHTYYHKRWFPIEKGQHFSAQACFDAVKQAAGIVRDIGFYATEMNVAKVGWPETTLDDAESARLFLTGLWDNIGVTGRNGYKPVTNLVFPWLLAETYQDRGIYSMSTQLNPWHGDSRADALKMVVDKAGDMNVRDVDHAMGELRLEGAHDSMIVWHNRQGWTNKPSTEFLLQLPPKAKGLEVWSAAGKIQSQSLQGETNVRISNLTIGQTYMFYISSGS